jgi:apolipoprotein N-acyltransferase
MNLSKNKKKNLNTNRREHLSPAKTQPKWFYKIIIDIVLVIFASFLFAASFPNPLFNHGLPFLMWFAYIPVLVVINKYNLPAAAGWGAAYGLLTYSLFNYWLSNFHPLAGTFVNCIYSIYIAIVFILLKLAMYLFPRRFYLVQWIIWLAYEYLRTLGFLGYSYGITGYSQWQVIPIIQIASITGVWGVSALVTFPSFWLASVINRNISGSEFYSRRDAEPLRTQGCYLKKHCFANNFCDKITVLFKKIFFLRDRCASAPQRELFCKHLRFCEKLTISIWLVLLTASLIFGFINMKDFSSYPSAQIALIQHNTDPWEASRAPTSWQITESYRRDLNNLIRLSNEALASEPKPQLVVWPETAFIPRIYWHTTYRDDQDAWLIVRDLLGYLEKQDVPFLIGNDDARRNISLNPDPVQNHRVDYNAAMLFENGINTTIYRKMHLVPFTEHFPYKRQFPFIYEWLHKANTYFWEKGSEETIFSLPDFTFAAPICFEDTFGYLSRNFVRRGADVLVNLTNDAWANSITAQYQHLTMAVFRAVENYRPMVRSTTSGQTCAIDPNGRVIAEAPPFSETWLNAAVPLVNRSKTTIYTIFGDYLGILFTALAVILLLCRAVWCTIKP